MTAIIKRHNHYVPEMYLDNWAQNKRIYTYQLLTSHENVPVWKSSAVKNTASIDNLYVRQSNGKEADDFEDFFMQNYETPAKDPLIKACTNQRMSTDDWWKLIEFVASQIVRTPSHYFKMHGIFKDAMPAILDTLSSKLNTVPIDEIKNHPKSVQKEELIPLSVRNTGVKPDDGHTIIEIQTINGKSLWLRSIKHLLSEGSSILHKHKWSIITVAEGVKWPTSDDPVICLKHTGPGKYDFEGKWGQSGTELIMPISPTKALYTQVGSKQPPRIALDHDQSILIKRIIVEHAFMFVYASEEDDDIPKIRQRIVDLNEYERVENEYKEWYDKYMEKEVPFLESMNQGPDT